MLLEISNISDKIENKELSDSLYTYSTLLMYKESIGQKRASLSALFSTKEFDKEIFEYFLTSDTQEKIYLKSFLHDIDNDIKEFYTEKLDKRTLDIVKKYEQLALEKISGKSVTVNPQKWFDSVTKKINRVQEVEYKIFNNIILKVNEISAEKNIDLTSQELLWIEKHPVIKVSNEDDWPPFDFSKNGEARGYSVDIVRLLAQKIGIEVEFVNGYTWTELTKLFDDGNLDMMQVFGKTADRVAKFHFSNTYIHWNLSYIIREDDNTIHSTKDFDGKRVALGKGWNSTKVFKKRYPKAIVIEYKSAKDMFWAVSLKKADIAIDNISSATYIMMHEHISNLKSVGLIELSDGAEDKDLHFASQKNAPELMSMFNKALDALSVTEKMQLQKKWFGKVINSSLEQKRINLTKEEKEWIKAHTIKIGVEQWMPVVFSNDGNDIDGIGGDFTKEIIKKTGLKIEVVNENWDKLLKDFEDKKLDLLPATYFTEKRAKFGLYSDWYFKMKDAIYLKSSNTQIRSLKDLEGKTLAIPKGYGTIDKLQKEFPKINLVFTKDLDDSINRVLNGRVTAFYEGHIAAKTKIKSELIEGLKSISVKEFESPTLHFFSKIDEPLLHSIIQKALKSLKYQDKQSIINKWASENNQLKLTSKEKAWLDKKETISYVYDPDWAPFEWTNELDQHTGIISDVLQLISASSGIEFKAIPTPKWSDSIKMMTDDKADMYSAVAITDKRKKYVNFTSKNIYSSPGVIVTKSSDETLYLDIKSALETKNVGLANGYAISDYVEKTYPDLKFTMVDSVQDGFQKLENNDIDLFILNAATAQYYIKQKGFSDLRIATKIDFTFDLKIALQKELPPEVLSILDKAIDTISEKELGDIYHKWTSIKIQTKTDWVLIAKISIVIVLILLFILWNNYQLKNKVKEKTKDIEAQTNYLELLVSSFDKNVIFTRTDLKGIITHASEAFCEISGYSQKELIGNPHNMVRHPDMPNSEFQKIWNAIEQEACIIAEVKNLKKDGGFYWVESKFEPEYDVNSKHIGYSAIRTEITDKKEVQELSHNLEAKVAAQTKDLKRQLRIVKMAERKQEELLIVVEEQKEFTQTLLDSQEQMIITTDGKTLLTANETFYDFFAVDSPQDFMEVYEAKCICDTFNTNAPQDYLQIQMGRETWIDYVISRSFNLTHKAMISMGNTNFIFSVTAAKLPGDAGIKSAVFTNITEMENAKLEIEAIHKHTRESIEYASLIQSALIPDNNLFRNYFQDYFAIWHPKDTVGGDIYLFEELRSEDECLLMVIDCTGHGVPGAFVTMLVKAIERQITSKIKHSDDVVSPANLLSVFNRNMKQLLKQESIDSISNAGFDGAIIHYNKKDKIIKFAGAETPLFYVEDEELKVIKGNRYSVGYKKCAMDYEYKEHIIEVKEGMQFYLTTDGYLDQNGGEKSFPFGKKRFQNIIKQYHKETMADQQEVFLHEFANYQEDEETNDDVTLIGLKI